MPKIYTKKGDEGFTHLASGEKVLKFHIRVDLYGNCDELNSYIGVVCSLIQEKQTNPKLKEIWDELNFIQSLIFEYSAELAGYYRDNQTILKEEDILHLEEKIDEWSNNMPELRKFILPGGSLIASFLHVCRTKCRDVERKLIYAIVEKKENIHPDFIKFFNRLSDYFFTLARYCNWVLDVPETVWESQRKKQRKSSAENR
ncbi:MAG: cob(I)yrinic acid a,c-diamide adenosyltransferase [Leptospiraceae bacterium]|nr:cob(I)yrinic acid a,c-diamide adenosyltransferase [Leptospiraceae bacterium]MDW7975474.1 cob(I)yrinic acid a,c-diamide adenosyltransferase [Leptospiraceae bacterium]